MTVSFCLFILLCDTCDPDVLGYSGKMLIRLDENLLNTVYGKFQWSGFDKPCGDGEYVGVPCLEHNHNGREQYYKVHRIKHVVD